tara:strand:+ start:123 stop:938 length:816 start_codon:yes stop_codon:yes gene_type:complete
MKNLSKILTLSLFLSIGLGCIDGVEVELWGECYNIEKTTYLNLSNSGLTGEIPSEIGDLTNLISLNLSHNNLSGEIPSEIGNLINLGYLNLSHNNLSGKIPPETKKLVNIEYYNFWFNEGLTGKFPLDIYNLKKEYDEKGNLVKEYRKLHSYSSNRQGLSTIYHKNGNKFVEGEFEYNQKIGKWTEWYKDGRVKQIEIFRHHIPSTLKKYSYHSNKKVYRIREYKFDQWGENSYPTPQITSHGTWIYYNEDGSLQKEEFYKDGKLIETIEY